MPFLKTLNLSVMWHIKSENERIMHINCKLYLIMYVIGKISIMFCSWLLRKIMFILFNFYVLDVLCDTNVIISINLFIRVI
jgi:hypothetical protein